MSIDFNCLSGVQIIQNKITYKSSEKCKNLPNIKNKKLTKITRKFSLSKNYLTNREWFHR